MLSRRVALLMAVSGMAVLMLALTSAASATGGGGPGGFGDNPTVVRTVPVEGATDVDENSNIKVKFSEPMKAKSITTGTFYLTEGGPCCIIATIPATVKYNDDTKTAVLNPTNPLAPNTTYTARVEGTGDGDHLAVKDRGGTPLATDYLFSFSTGSECSGCTPA